MAVYSLHKLLRYFKHTCGFSYHWNPLFVNDYNLQFRITSKCINIYSKMNYSDMSDIDESVPPKKKKIFIPRITLLSEKNQMSIVTLDEANKIAKRQNLRLVKVDDVNIKSEREIYKLMKIRDFIEAEAKTNIENKTIKETKTITMSSKISEHDLETKIKSIHKILGKRHGVRVVIPIDGNKEKASQVANYITTKSKPVAEITSKNESGHNIKIILRPNLNKLNDQESEKTQTSSTDEVK